MHPIAEEFPFIALIARYNQDSGDGDSSKEDFVEDCLNRWLDKPKINKFINPKYMDVTYTIETKDLIRIVNLGTEKKLGWKSNVSPFPIRKYGGHNGFFKGGIDTFEAIQDILNCNKSIRNTGHSRGGPRTSVISKLIYENLGTKPLTITYNAPPVFTRKTAKKYNNYNIPTLRIIKNNDLIDNIAEKIFFKHVGVLIKLPKTKGIIDNVPFIGGHAYTSVFNGLIKYFTILNKAEEVNYLYEKKGICTI